MSQEASSTTVMPALRIVLVEPQHPGNIGAAARAMRTMGLFELALVAPEKFPHPDAQAMAAGADDVLERAGLFPTLAEAIADCRWVMGCTARRRHVVMDEFEPSAAAHRLWQAGSDGPVALVFGRERTGLFNEELELCHAAVHIPTDPSFSSLNLAAAVQVMAWEWRRVALARGAVESEPVQRADPPATAAQMEHFFVHLDQLLHDIEFHKGREPATVMRRLRQLFLRAQPDQRELRVLRGIFADAQRMARLAGQGGENR